MGKKQVSYKTHHNGGRPYTVKIGATVDVYKNSDDDEPSELIRTFHPQRIFVGASPRNEMTEFSGGYGEKFDGNSILLDLGNKDYVFIGDKVAAFHAADDIDTFVSPVGNNDVPYPYALDIRGRCYLFIEDVILERLPLEERKDPYDFYYEDNILVSNPPKADSKYAKFLIGDEEYRLTYSPDPFKDYDRLLTFPENVNKTVSVVTFKGRVIQLTKKKYANIHKKFASEKGYKPLVYEVLDDAR